MNRNTLALFVALVVLVLGGCQPAVAPDTNRNLTASASPTKEAFDPAAIQAELLKLEQDWAGAFKNRDAEIVRRIVAEDTIMVYPDGTAGTKADEVRSIESGAMTADSWEMLDPKVTVIDADAAFVTGRSIIRNGKYKDPNQKKPIDISGEYRFLDVYAKRDGKWQAVASQATRIENPAAAASPSPAAAASPSASVPRPPSRAASPSPSTRTTPAP